MNILFICDEYPPGLNGGIGSITQSLSRALVSQGHKVCVVGLYSEQYGSSDYEEDQGVKVWRLRYKRSWPHTRLSYKAQRNLPPLIQSRLPAFKTYKSFLHFVERLVEQEHIDVIEMADWSTCIYEIGVNMPLPRLDVPVVLKFNGSMTYFNYELKRPLKKKRFAVDKAIFDRADALVAASTYTANINRQLFGSHRPIDVLYNSIEIPAAGVLAAPRDERTVVFAGTLIEKKGIFSLMKAWNKVIKSVPDATLLVFGKGDTAVLQALLEPQASATVVFKGHQTKATLLETFRTATLAIFPSYTEAFSLAPLESMSMGCPTIFTTRSSGREIITEGETGMLVDPDNIEEIAQKMIMILENKALQQKLGKEGKDIVERKFNIVHAATDHVAYYSKVIEKFHAKNK